jgi:hypothetical protein
MTGDFREDQSTDATAYDAGTMTDGVPAAEVDAIASGIGPVVVAAPARSTRWLVFLAGVRRVGLVFLAIVFFAGGAALGYAAFVASRVPAPIPGDAGIAGVQPPPVVQEFITALGRNDSDAIRSALPPQPHKDLTDLMTSYGIQNLEGTEILGTLVDGTRSATEIVMKGARTNGNPFAINLVILADSGQIKGFR